jgi:hypothetical protein
MPIHSDAYLNSLIADQEAELSRKTKAIYDRFEIAITAGQSRYTLPENIFSVIEVGWQGESVDVSDISDYGGDAWYKPNNLSSQATRPRFFMLANYGYKTIQFHPVPAVSYSLTGGDLFTRSGYNAAIVISCYRVADISGSAYRLRSRLLRNTIKYRAMERAYLKAGPGQDLKASEYFKSKADFIEDKFVEIYNKMPRAVLQADPDFSVNKNRIPRPVLPTTGPWSF